MVWVGGAAQKLKEKGGRVKFWDKKVETYIVAGVTYFGGEREREGGGGGIPDKILFERRHTICKWHSLNSSRPPPLPHHPQKN